MKNKNLIKDILTYLKDNEEAREEFEGINYSLDSIKFDIYEEFYELKEYEKQIFLIHALSSPNGKPICGFLEEDKKDFRGVSFDGKKVVSKYKINHAKTLRTIYLDALDNGDSHDEALKLINDKYNELC